MNARIVTWEQATVGTVGLAWGRSPLAWAIEEAEDIAGEGPNPPSHAFLVAPQGRVLEAVWPRVALTPMYAYRDATVELYQLDVSDFQARLAYYAVERQWLGRWYDVLGLFGFIPVELARGLRIGFVHNWIQDRRAAWCSELVCQWLRQPGIRCAPPDIEDVDPAGLRAWLRAMVSGPRAA